MLKQLPYYITVTVSWL